MEWWDLELLPTKLKKQVTKFESEMQLQHAITQLQQLGDSKEEHEDTIDTRELESQCFDQAALSHSKTAALVQHIVPVKTNREYSLKEPTLFLTKRELKRQRKLRRSEKQRLLLAVRECVGLRPLPQGPWRVVFCQKVPLVHLSI